MTREEEIKAKAQELLPDIMDDEYPYRSELAHGFIAGAKWADEHPKDGLVSIDKACEWLRYNVEKYMRSIGVCMYFDVINCVKNFKHEVEE